MKHFGAVISFDETSGRGLIRPNVGENDIRFERSEVTWDQMVWPNAGVSVFYDLSTINGETCATQLHAW